MTTQPTQPSIEVPVTRNEVHNNDYNVAEFIEYLRWLAEQDEGFSLSAGKVWKLSDEGIRVGRLWSEVCEDLKLPVREDWL